MLKKLSLIVLLCTITAGGVQAAQNTALKGKTLYTQVNMYAHKGGSQISWVNFEVGTFIPVNSKVKVIQLFGKNITFKIIKSGKLVKLRNRPKHSGMDGKAWGIKHLNEKPLDLNQFSKAERNAIRDGIIQAGMSKEAVIISRGYPPAHKNPTLEAPQWLYWSNRSNKKVVSFDENGNVFGIRTFP